MITSLLAIQLDIPMRFTELWPMFAPIILINAFGSNASSYTPFAKASKVEAALLYVLPECTPHVARRPEPPHNIRALHTVPRDCRHSKAQLRASFPHNLCETSSVGGEPTRLKVVLTDLFIPHVYSCFGR